MGLFFSFLNGGRPRRGGVRQRHSRMLSADVMSPMGENGLVEASSPSPLSDGRRSAAEHRKQVPGDVT
jgi:hypothetical protein